MKEKKLYSCEYCYTDYADKKMALDCEKNHKVDLSIVSARYSPFKNNQTGFPVAITVESKDGAERTYHI